MIFPTLQILIDNTLKNSDTGWCKLDGELRTIESIKIMINGELKPNNKERLYLYNYGVENSEYGVFTGGVYGGTTSSFVKETNYLMTTVPANSSGNSYFTLTYPLDFTNFNKLCINWEGVINNPGNIITDNKIISNRLAIIGSTRATNLHLNNIVNIINETSHPIITQSVDISELTTGLQYLRIGSQNNYSSSTDIYLSSKIYQVWLE